MFLTLNNLAFKVLFYRFIVLYFSSKGFKIILKNIIIYLSNNFSNNLSDSNNNSLSASKILNFFSIIKIIIKN